MIDEKDVYRSAKLMIDRHGDEAPLHAAMRADKMLALGALGGQRTWIRILRATEELLRGRGGDRLH